MLGIRLKELRKQKGFTQAALAEALGITQQAVGKWETGRTTPDALTLARLAEYLGVSADALLGGEGHAPAAPLQPYSRAVAAHLQFPTADAMVPVVGTVRAGYGALAFEEDLGSEPASVRDPESYFYLVVKGDSMEPRIRDGDLALVRRQPTLEDGDLGVVIYGDGEGTLKRFLKKGAAVVLQPFNPAYEAVILSGEELDHLYVAGKVVETKARW